MKNTWPWMTSQLNVHSGPPVLMKWKRCLERGGLEGKTAGLESIPSVSPAVLLSFETTSLKGGEGQWQVFAYNM